MTAPLGRTPQGVPLKPDVEVVILGAGFSGIGMAIALLKAGRASFTVLEKGADVGGTWRDNHYPGAACDVPSHLYSFSFEQNPHWSRMYPTQSEIHDYLRRTADKYGVTPRIRFNTTAVHCGWDDATGMWRVRTGDGRTLTARAVVSGMGFLSRPALPQITGIDKFEGRVFHSAEWDHAYDLTGKRVAVIGTGASAIQFVPEIAPKVAQLTLFQRTPPWVMPKLDRPMRGWEKATFERFPALQNLFRQQIYARMETRAYAFTLKPEILKKAQALGLEYLEAVVPDPELRARLTPDYTIGCKRVLISNDYYPALNRPNVEVVTDGVAEATATGLKTRTGRRIEVDAIVFGTGFTVTEMLAPTEITGRDGRSLNAEWRRDIAAYLGTTVAGYPNLFFLMGPNTGLGHNSMIYMIESQIHYVLRALDMLDAERAVALDVRPQAQAVYNAELDRRLKKTVWASGCKSWYVSEDGRNPTLWPGFTFEFRRRTRRVDRRAYDLVRAPVDA